MSSFSDKFRRHMKLVGGSRYERNLHDKTREFENYFNNTLNKEECYIDGEKQYAVFQDNSQSNNKDLSDDKYVILPNNVTCDIGSYIIWRDDEWLVFTEEFKTIPTHQQLKIKHVNQKIKWITDYEKKTISNDGKGWGAYVQNQTLYTLGVSFTGDHLSLINGKMMLYVKNNEETSQISIGDRFFVGGKIYKVEFSDTISRVGLINLLLDEDTINKGTDNSELGIADYWKDTSSDNTDQSTATTTENVDWQIIGESKVKLARSYAYKVVKNNSDGTQEQLKVDEWNIESISDMPLNILERDQDMLQFKVIDDARNVGKTVNIMAKVNGQIKNLSLKIVAKFS